jgi:acyl-coenzyme A thioesterase PaaI-like protein
LTSDVRRRAESGGAATVDGREFTFEPHRCFACGVLNEHGLHLQLHVDDAGCWTELVLDERFQGWEGVAHGGIVCTILDEVMAWSVIGRDTWGVTARMTVEFKRPVHVGRRLRGEGRVTEDRRRLFRTAGTLFDAESGETLAAAEATFVSAPPDQLAALKARYRLRPAEDGSPADAPSPRPSASRG